jgi:alpha-methylacyl-CoA racemase
LILLNDFPFYLVPLGTDACAVPVLTPQEATAALESSPMPEFHPHVRGHSQYQQSSHEGLNVSDLILKPGQHTEELLTEAGLSNKDIKRLALEGVLGEEAQKSAYLNAKL